MPAPMPRRTPYEDNMISEKHRRIYPTEFELNLIQKTVRTVETSLRQVSDSLPNESEKNEVESEEGQELVTIGCDLRIVCMVNGFYFYAGRKRSVYCKGLSESDRLLKACCSLGTLRRVWSCFVLIYLLLHC